MPAKSRYKNSHEEWRNQVLFSKKAGKITGYDSDCMCQVGGISQKILAKFFPWVWLLVLHTSKKPPRKKSVGHDEWQRTTLLEPDKQKRVCYRQKRQNILRIRRAYLTSHNWRKKCRSICLSLKACGTAGRRSYFRKYGATCHVTRESKVMIQSFFDDGVI